MGNNDNRDSLQTARDYILSAGRRDGMSYGQIIGSDRGSALKVTMDSSAAERQASWDRHLRVSGQKYYNSGEGTCSRKPIDYLDETTFKALPENIQGQLLMQANGRSHQFRDRNHAKVNAAQDVQYLLEAIEKMDGRLGIAQKYSALTPEVSIIVAEDISKQIEKINKIIADRDESIVAGDAARAGERQYRTWYLDTVLASAETEKDEALIEEVKREQAKVAAATATDKDADA